uniref:Pericentrin, putative n=1 Tax=Schistosoma mansoni TaxID=6183 RepID=A0A5K4F3S4_SCHMA
MEVVYHELSAGKDTSLSQVLSEWSRRYEEKYAALQLRFSGLFSGENYGITNTSRPRSGDVRQPSYNELLEEIQSALQLKANLSVELEALQQIRSELEDSECMSEVHFRLERATENNRRLHAALQAADEQITELVLSKRLLEAQMNELRNSRDAELVEAKERVRAAERAVIAATRSVNSCKPVSEKDKQAHSREPGILGHQNVISNPSQTFMPLAFKKPLQNHSRNYTTLTAFSYDDFDSLDEDTDDETDKHLSEMTAAVDLGENNLDLLVENKESNVEAEKEISTAANNDADIRHNQECPMESSMEDNVFSKDMDNVTSSSSPSFVGEVLDSVSPALSSTPRKSLPNETVVTPFSCANLSDLTNDVLGWNSDLKTTPYIKQEEEKEVNEVVSKVDYLRLLDEMEELRQELDLLRQNAQLSQLSHNNNISKPVINNRMHLTSDNPGLTTQLLELKDELVSISNEPSSQKPSSLLPALPPGSTRLYDWSLNKSDLQLENEMSANKSSDSETSTDKLTPVPISLSPCDHCVELQAKIMAYEAIHAAQEDFLTEKIIEQSILNTEAGTQCDETLQEVDNNTTENYKLLHIPNNDIFTQIDPEVKNVLSHSVCLQTEPNLTMNDDDQIKNYTVCLEFYHKMILSIIDASTKLKHELTAHINDQNSWMNNDLLLDYAMKHSEQDRENELKVQLLNDYLNECDHLLVTNVISDTKYLDHFRTDCKSLTSIFGQLLPEIDRLLTLCKIGCEKLIRSTDTSRLNQVDVDIENCELVRNLREQLLTAHQLLTEKLPVETKIALLETSQIVETERIQLQAEMDRRLSEFERNHTASLVELETSRHDLMQQLDEMELINRELKNEIFSVQQKLQAKEKFLNEQTEERELEREEFRIELNRLKSELEMKKSQMMSYKLLDTSDTDSCTTPLNIKETGQNNFVPHWISDLKMGHLCQNDTIKSNIQTLVQSKSWDIVSWNKPNDSDEDMISGNINNKRSQNQYKYVDQQNDWQPYTIPTISEHSNFVDSVTNTSGNYDIQNYPDEIDTKQVKVIDDSNAYIQQHQVNLCDACTQVEVITFDKFVEATIDSVDMEVQVAIDDEVKNLETMNSHEQLNLVQSSPKDNTNHSDNTRYSNQPTRTTKTITRSRTWNTTSAAAVLSHIVVKEEEEESIVTVVDESDTRNDSKINNNNNNQKFYQDQIEKCKLEISNLRKQLDRINTCHKEMEQTKQSLEFMQHKQDKGIQTMVFCQNLSNDIKLKTSLTHHMSSSIHRMHHHSLPALFSPSFSSNNEDTGVEMSQGLLDLESIESISPPTAKSPIIQDLILMGHEKCSSPEDENLQTLMGSPISDKDDELENEIPEIMLSSEHLDTTPSLCVSENACCKTDSVDSDPQTVCAISNDDVENPGAVVPLSEVSTLIEQLMDSEVLIKTLRNEISGLTKYQIELQHDYDTVHEMLVERQNDLTRVTEQLLETENKCKSLSKQLLERKDVILERDEDIFLLSEDKKSLEIKVTQLELEIEELKTQVKYIDRDKLMSSAFVQTDLMNSRSLFSTKIVQTDDIPISLESQPSVYSDPSKNVNLNILYDRKNFHPNIEQEHIHQIWATSTPKEEESPNSTFLSSENDTLSGAVSSELNNLSNRLREESVRLATATAIATARQSICDRPGSILINKTNDNEETTIKVECNECAPWIIEIRNSYGDLKEAVNEVAKIIHNNPWINEDQYKLEDSEETMRMFMNRLLVSLTKALDTDEKLWISVITSSINQTCDILRSRTSSVPNLALQLPTENILCQIIQHLTERVSAFMRREDEFRKCLIDVLHVEEASFKSELKTYVNRSDALVGEMNRLTKVVSSLSEQLNHANNRTNEVQGQLHDLQVDLVHTQNELQLKEDEVQRQRTDVEQLRLQLCEENTQTERFRTELETLQSAKVQAENELSSSNNLIQELKISLTNEKNRAQSLKIELDQLYDQIRKNTYQTTPTPNNNNNAIGGNMTTTNENKAPNDCSSNLNPRVYEAINLATTQLASTRRDTIKLQNQVKELQATAHSLRLNIAEAELRLMPTLTSVLPGTFNLSGINNTSQSSMIKQSAAKKKSLVYGDQSALTSAKFTKLKNVCVDLLSRVGVDERDDDDLQKGDDNDDHNSDSHSSDDDSIEENIFIGSGIINSLNRDGGYRIDAERDESSLNNGNNNCDILNKGSCRSNKATNRRSTDTLNNSLQSTSNSHVKTVNVLNSNKIHNSVQTFPIMTTNVISSSPNAHINQTVSMEQYFSLYVRFLRAQSYRRSLSFQKHYLLLLLGNFQYAENVVVAILGCPESRVTSQTDSKDRSSQVNLSPLRRFRTIGRVVQVIHRMKHLVNKWRRLDIPSMESTPINNKILYMHTNTPTSYYAPPFQHRSFSSTLDRSNQTNRIPNGSLRIPLKELHAEESNNIYSSALQNSSLFNGKQYLSNYPVHTPRLSHIQTSPSGYSSLLENQTISTGSSHRRQPHSSFNLSTTTSAVNSTGIPISRQFPITCIPINKSNFSYDRSFTRNSHQQSSSSSSSLSIENRHRVSSVSSSIFCRVDSIQTQTVRTSSHSHHSRNQIISTNKRPSYS